MLLSALVALIFQLNHAEAATYTREQLVEIASTTAQTWGLNQEHFVETIACESQFNPDAIGDQGTSFGLAQIHLPAHPDISKEQAEDPIFAMQWMANEWSNNRASEWSCWKNYEKNGWPPIVK